MAGVFLGVLFARSKSLFASAVPQTHKTIPRQTRARPSPQRRVVCTSAQRSWYSVAPRRTSADLDTFDSMAIHVRRGTGGVKWSAPCVYRRGPSAVVPRPFSAFRAGMQTSQRLAENASSRRFFVKNWREGVLFGNLAAAAFPHKTCISHRTAGREPVKGVVGSLDTLFLPIT